MPTISGVEQFVWENKLCVRLSVVIIFVYKFFTWRPCAKWGRRARPSIKNDLILGVNTQGGERDKRTEKTTLRICSLSGLSGGPGSGHEISIKITRQM